MHFLLIDHYDSFTFNVVDWLEKGGINLVVVPYDQQNKIPELKFHGIVLSPGPHSPEFVPASMDFVRSNIGILPILGICLGHQILSYYFGGSIEPLAAPFHGHSRTIHRTNHCDPLLSGLPDQFMAAGYNSLTVTGLPPNNHEVLATSEGNQIEMVRFKSGHSEAPTYGIQFHPESFMSEFGSQICANWINLCRLHSEVIGNTN